MGDYAKPWEDSPWKPEPDAELAKQGRQWTDRQGWHYPGDPNCDCGYCDFTARDYYEKQCVTSREALDAELALNEKLRKQLDEFAMAGIEQAARHKVELEARTELGDERFTEIQSLRAEVERLRTSNTKLIEKGLHEHDRATALRAEVARLTEDFITMDGIAAMHSKNHVDAKCEVARLKEVNGEQFKTMANDVTALRALVTELRGYAQHDEECYMMTGKGDFDGCNCGLAALKEE